jgi:site-specific DNA recombinase
MVAPAPMDTLRAALYCRVSTQEQGQRGYSLGAQEDDARGLAAQLGAEVVAVYRDQDSGASWDLPGLNAMLDAAKRHEFEVLIVYDPDRLARNMAKQLVLEEELHRYGVAIRYCTLRLGDTAEDRLLKNMRASISEYEREKIALRTSRGKRAKAERGEYVGVGAAPYGYRMVRQVDPRTQRARVVGLEPDPATAPVAQRIFQEAADHSMYRIVIGLNADGIPSPTGKPLWGVSTVRDLLRNPTYMGQAAYGRYDSRNRPTDPSTWLRVPVPALVSAEAWEAAQRAVRGRKALRRVRRDPEQDPYTLREALRCGHCGRALACMDAKSGGRVYRYYQCLSRFPHRALAEGIPPCSLPGIPAEALEEATWARIGAALLDRDHLEAGLTASRAEYDAAAEHWSIRRATVEREIAQRRAKLKELLLDRAEAPRGSETRRVLDEAVQEAEAALGRLTDELAKLTPTDLPGLAPEAAEALASFAADVRAGLTAATPPERRQVVHLLQLRGTVRQDEERGVRFGRHAFTVQWEAAITLPDNEQGFLTPCMVNPRARVVAMFSGEVTISQWLVAIGAPGGGLWRASGAARRPEATSPPVGRQAPGRPRDEIVIARSGLGRLVLAALGAAAHLALQQVPDALAGRSKLGMSHHVHGARAR